MFSTPLQLLFFYLFELTNKVPHYFKVHLKTKLKKTHSFFCNVGLHIECNIQDCDSLFPKTAITASPLDFCSPFKHEKSSYMPLQKHLLCHLAAQCCLNPNAGFFVLSRPREQDSSYVWNKKWAVKKNG